MNKSDQGLLIEAIYNKNEFVIFSKSHSISITRKQEKLLKSRIKEDLNDPKKVKNYKIRNDKVIYYYHSYKTDFMGINIIQCDLEIPPKFSMSELEDSIRSLDRRIKIIHINTHPKLKLAKDFLRMNAVNKGIRLIASVHESLNELNFSNHEVFIRDANKKDLIQTIPLEFKAHRTSQSSMIRHMKKVQVERFHKHLLKTNKKFLVAIINDIVVGHIAVSVNAFNVGHIMTIAVSPEYQGQGISKYLYYELLKYLKSKRVRIYSGVSTTDEVIGLAKKLKRRPMGIYLETSY